MVDDNVGWALGIGVGAGADIVDDITFGFED